MFKCCFYHNTLFIIPYFVQVYLRNRTSYRSTVKCVVKRKKERIQIICQTQNRDLPPSETHTEVKIGTGYGMQRSLLIFAMFQLG